MQKMNISDQDVDKIINDFCKSTDDELALQKNLNEFSKNITPRLLKKINTGEAVLAGFGEKKFAFRINSTIKNEKSIIYAVGVMDLEKFNTYFKLGVIDSYRPKTATFECEPEYSMEEQISNALTLLLFDVFGIEIGAQSLGDDGMVKL